MLEHWGVFKRFVLPPTGSAPVASQGWECEKHSLRNTVWNPLLTKHLLQSALQSAGYSRSTRQCHCELVRSYENLLKQLVGQNLEWRC